MTKTSSLAAFMILLLVTKVAAFSQEKPTLLQQATLSRTHIAFTYAGDLWIVPRGGGEAVRLTTGTGQERQPLFSPDGSAIAFTGEYDGNVDVYVVPASGGVPRRLTYHPGTDAAKGWTSDGRQILFASSRSSDSSFTSQLFTIATDGVFPVKVPLPAAYEGAYSPDGARLAYLPVGRAFSTWKRYRGGRTTPIWIANLSDSSVEKVPRDNSNDFNPMWPAADARRIYFLSDRNGPVTLFAYDTSTRKVEQLVRNSGLDIKSAFAGPDAIVYEQFGSLHLYDLKSRRTTPVNVTLQGDMASVRPTYEKVGEVLSNPSISPTGVRAVFEARGEILTVPAEKGDVRNLTNTPGTAERDPAWSPDGRWIAYFSDASGEYALHLREQSGLGELKKIALGEPPSFFYRPTWSPDSRKVAFRDKRPILWYVDIDKGTLVKVDSSPSGGSSTLQPYWSPDSRWISYSKMLPCWMRAVFVYSIEDGKSRQLTDGMSDARHSVFDKSGKYLYFTASTSIGPTNAGLDMSSYPLVPTRSVYLAVLKKGEPSPLAPLSDEEKTAQDKPEEKAADAQKKAEPGGRREPPQVVIDFDNIGRRILALPVSERRIAGLKAGKANVLFIAESPATSPAAPSSGPGGMIVHKFDLEKQKLERVLEGVAALDISANGEKVLYRQGQSWFIASTAQLVKPGEGKLKTEDMEVRVDPRAEWEQMYREVWRIERDFFYDPNHHGLDLKAAEKKYAPYLAALAHRADLNYLFNEMLGELSVGHLGAGGGDLPDTKRVPGGLLGCDYEIADGRYRFARVFSGENWNPNQRGPLTQPGAEVQAGEFLLAVNGRNITAGENVYSFFENTSGKSVTLRVGPNADGSNAREISVVPRANEGTLRYLAWIEGNRRKVDQMSGGQLAYVHLPDTAIWGFNNFNRYYFAQLDKQGAIVDERFNGGGLAADYIVDFLRKPIMNYWASRDEMDATTPFGVIPGPKVMIINENAGSGGDLMPWLFRRMKIGPLVGKRTWGGLVGTSDSPPLIDGGFVTAPDFGFYSPESQWEVENHGVAPDIEIDLDPAQWRNGRDSQVERAVRVAMEELNKNTPRKPQRPPYPNYHRKPPQ